MVNRLDDIDRRVLYHLAANARDTSTPDVADEVNVSPGTIRNRIHQLEDEGIIRGYHAHVDYERADALLTNLFTCTVSVSDRGSVARELLDIPGVIGIREIMSGSESLHVKAVGTDTEDLTRIGRQIEALGVTVVDEDLIQREYYQPYEPYGPADAHRTQPMTNFLSLAGEAEVLDVTVTEEAPIAELTLAEANEQDLLDQDVLVVAIERDDEVRTPKGHTTIEPGDLVTVFTPSGLTQEVIAAFGASGKTSV